SRPVPTIAGAMTSIFELAPLGELAQSPWSGFIPTRARMRSLVTEGAADQKEQPGLFACRPPFPRLSQRADVLVFQTPPLQEEVELTGHISARLWVSSSAPDTDFTVKLLDVYPPNPDYPEGYDLNLVDGILRVRYRNGFEKEEPMRPGEVHAIEIDLPPTSNCFKAGHRIRVDVSSSNFPRFDVNPNTGEPTGRHTRSQPARNRVYLDAGRPSHLILPVIPRSRSR
ncbi:MAG: CocE/NonD family hydrolase, partial [Acidobacteriota bacterium]|nr:CocE/NonD family hydrolase [Acidobacteriota bacterium]